MGVTMRRIFWLAGALAAMAACVDPVYAFDFGAGGPAVNTTGASLPTCTAQTKRHYVILDPTSATDTQGGAAQIGDNANYVYCDQDDLEWRVLASSYIVGGSGGSVDSVFGRTEAVVAQAGDYTVSQVTDAASASNLSSTATGLGASMVGIEDAGALFTAADVEAALAEVMAAVNARVPESGEFGNAADLEPDGSLSVGVVGGSELDELSVEAPLEAVLDLQDMQGAITVPGQVNATGTPDGTTFLRGDGVWASSVGGVTNLTATPSPTSVTVESDTGTDATIPQAVSGGNAGVLSGSDKAKLDGVVVVNSESELEAAFRARDLPASDPGVASIDVLLGENFPIDPTATSPLELNVPVGGSGTPRVKIDLGGHRVVRRVDPSGPHEGCALKINTGNVGGTCGTPAAFYSDEEGCQGVEHDAEILLGNGSVSNDWAGCDGSPSADCGRIAVCLENDELRGGAVGSEGFGYGIRFSTWALKIGFDTELAGSTSLDSLSLPDDAGIRVGVNTTGVNIGEGTQIDAVWGVRILPDPYGGDQTSTALHFDGTRFSDAGTVSDDEGGLLDIRVAMNGNGAGSIGAILGDARLNFGTLGRTRGGNFGLRVAGLYANGSVNCYADGSEDWFLDAGTDPAEPVTGTIVRSGQWCTRGGIQSGGFEAFTLYDYIRDATGPLPGWLATDAEISGGGHTRLPPLSVPIAGDVRDARYVAQSADWSTLAGIADLGSVADPDVVSGAAMGAATSRYSMALGPARWTAVGTTPDVYEIRNLDALSDLPICGTEATDKLLFDGSTWTCGVDQEGSGTDASAIHDDELGEINAITAKTLPVPADLLLIEDSAAGFAKKKLALSDIKVDWSDITSTASTNNQTMFVGGNLIPSGSGFLTANGLHSGTSDPTPGGRTTIDTDGDGADFDSPTFAHNISGTVWYAPLISGYPSVDGHVATYDAATDSLEWAIPLASGLSGSGQIDDDDIADGAVDGGVGGEIQDDTITMDDLSPTLNLLTSGTIRGAVDVVTSSANLVLTADQARGSMHVSTNATPSQDYTLPDAASGLGACFYDLAGNGVIVDPNGTDEIVLDGSALTAGNAIDSPGVATQPSSGDFACLLAIDTDTWIVLGVAGTWIDGGAD